MQRIDQKIKFWFDVNKDNLINGLKLLIPIVLLFFFWKKVPETAKNLSLRAYDQSTWGIIDRIEARKGIHESMKGSQLIVKDYQIDYYYILKEEKISQTEIIDRDFIPQKTLIKLKHLKSGDSLKVRYKLTNKKEAKIDLN